MQKNRQRFGLVLASIGAMLIAANAQAQSIELDSISFEPKAMAMLANVDVSLRTGSVLSARIRHHYLPRQPDVYAMPAKTAPARTITDKDLEVRVVYARFLPDEEPIDFTAD